MFSDKVRPSRRRSEQSRALGAYIRRQVYPFSDFYRPRLASPTAVKKLDDLAALDLTTYDDLVDPAGLVLQPTGTGLVRYASFEMSLRAFFGRLLGQGAAVDRTVIEPLYKPVHWVLEGALPVASSKTDFDRLAEIGRRWLEAAGVVPSDRIVSLLPAGAHLPFWQAFLGAGRAGVSLVPLGPDAPPAEIARHAPTVLVGRPGDLLDVVDKAADEGGSFTDVRLLLSAGDPLDEATRRDLAKASGAKVLAAWSPPGVRAMWAECHGASGLHTWPQSEIIEVVDGEVVWTALDWAGTVLVRLRTGVRATGLDDDVCPACGRSNPRLQLDPAQPWYALVLDTEPGVAAWQVEMTGDDLVVYLTPATDSHPGPLVRELDRQLAATQFVVLERPVLDRRLAAAGDQRVVSR